MHELGSAHDRVDRAGLDALGAADAVGFHHQRHLRRLVRAAGHDDTLVVVGTLHLLGSDGVVEKLRAKGYTVERICAACTAEARKTH